MGVIIKYRIFGHPRLLMRGLSGARAEFDLATMAYNIKRITNVLGVGADDVSAIANSTDLLSTRMTSG
jgi:hypothetical protein